MDTINDLMGYARNQATIFPELKQEIYDLVLLCIDEIADGASEQNEIYLCISDIDNLIKDFKNERKS